MRRPNRLVFELCLARTGTVRSWDSRTLRLPLGLWREHRGRELRARAAQGCVLSGTAKAVGYHSAAAGAESAADLGEQRVANQSMGAANTCVGAWRVHGMNLT